MATSGANPSKDKVLTVAFGDTVLLPHDTIGTVRFIGETEFKKNIIFYGIHLKEAIGKNDGSFNNRKYFKCPKSHGIFTEKKNIIDILKKHSISASFHHGQNVQIINSNNNNKIGKGTLSYIGLTKYDKFKNYYYGVKLNANIKEEYIKEITNNQHIQTIKKKNIYFDADSNRSIFVRQNQLRCISSKKKPKKGPKVIRSQSMLPQKKSKLKQKAKKMKTSKEQSNDKTESKRVNTLDIPNTSKQSKISSKKKKKLKEIRAKRMTKSDLGQITKNTKKAKVNLDVTGCLTPSKVTKKSNKKNKKKKKGKMRKRRSASTITVPSKDTIKYHEVINNEDKYCKYVDDKNFYYHQQFTHQYKKEHQDIIMNRIRARSLQSPPPTMGSFFSTRSRLNQRKKRMLPLPPQTYSITIDTRPMGFFIETKKLYTITETKDNEQVTQQVEVVDQENKFNKVNAYISMIQSSEWKDRLIIGSQLLSINEQSLTGLSFTKIFEKLSSHTLPFTLSLAAPNQNEDDYDMVNMRKQRMQRGKTFDETTASVNTEKKWKFKFQLF